MYFEICFQILSNSSPFCDQYGVLFQNFTNVSYVHSGINLLSPNDLKFPAFSRKAAVYMNTFYCYYFGTLSSNLLATVLISDPASAFITMYKKAGD